MLTTQLIFLLAALLCLLTFLVLCGLSSHAPGVAQARWAAVLGICTNLLFAYGRSLPPLIAYELADAACVGAAAALVVSYRRLFARPTQWSIVVSSVVALTLLVAVFHYYDDSFLARSALVSAYQAGAAATIFCTVLGARGQWRKPHYPKHFILAVCGLIALANLARVVVQVAAPARPASLLEPSSSAIFFLSLSSVSIPALALGALLLGYRRVLARVEEAADRDFLTGALSRRAFFNIGEREVARASRRGSPLAVLQVDFDNFKPINDSFGHDAGDRALVAFVERAASTLRVSDPLCRLGGDEFAILMPETSLNDAFAAAQRVRKLVETTVADDVLFGVTLSIGVGLLRRGESFVELLKRADQALYSAKRNGRDQVVVFSDEPA